METIFNQYKQKFGTNLTLSRLAEFLTAAEAKELLQSALDKGKPVNLECELEDKGVP